MNLRFKLLAASCLLASAATSHADWGLDFVRVTCIPESRYFEIEYRSLNGPDVLLEAELDDRKRAERLDTWRAHGFYEASNVKYECILPASTYEVVADQPPPQAHGTCGLAPRIILSLKRKLMTWSNLIRNEEPMITSTRDEDLILEGIIFGPDCFGPDPTVISIAISDGLLGWTASWMTLCFLPQGETEQHCRSIEFRHKLEKFVPITQESINAYFEKSE